MLHPNGLGIAILALVFVIGGALILYLRHRRLESERRQLLAAPAPLPPKRYVAPPKPATPDAPTAVLVVSGYTQAGLGMLKGLAQAFGDHYKRAVFLCLIVPETGFPDDPKSLDALRASHEEPLENYVPAARLLGLDAEYRCALGLLELGPICREILRKHPRACFVLSRAPVPGTESMVSTLREDLTQKVRSEFVRTRTPFFEMAVSLPVGEIDGRNE